MTLEEAEDRFDGCPGPEGWVAFHGVSSDAALSLQEIVEITARKGNRFWCEMVRRYLTELTDRQRELLSTAHERAEMRSRRYADTPALKYLRRLWREEDQRRAATLIAND